MAARGAAEGGGAARGEAGGGARRIPDPGGCTFWRGLTNLVGESRGQHVLMGGRAWNKGIDLMGGCAMMQLTICMQVQHVEGERGREGAAPRAGVHGELGRRPARASMASRAELSRRPAPWPCAGRA